MINTETATLSWLPHSYVDASELSVRCEDSTVHVSLGNRRVGEISRGVRDAVADFLRAEGRPSSHADVIEYVQGLAAQAKDCASIALANSDLDPSERRHIVEHESGMYYIADLVDLPHPPVLFAPRPTDSGVASALLFGER